MQSLYLIHCVCASLLLLATTSAKGSCHFPSSWHGTWFQAGVHYPIKIQRDTINFRGTCISHRGYKFLLKDSKRNCYRCLVINERHRNVLQYKESYCDQKQSLRELCGRITGDTSLYSLFRSENARPVPCPLHGEFRMEYQRGWGWCRRPVSEIQRCTSDTSLLFRFHACPDIRGSESSTEELQCLATWKEGSTRYLVGKFYHYLAKSDEDRFRCFVYERLKGEVTYLLAQSGDGTCNGMFSATEGARTMRLTKVNATQQELLCTPA